MKVVIAKRNKCYFKPISSNIPSFNFGCFNNFFLSSLLEMAVGENGLMPNIFAFVKYRS